jgi:hypothetical protein
VLDWAFTVMGLRNVLLVTFSWNLPAIRAYSKAGFREIGRRRGTVVTLGQRYDQVLMDAMAEEFTGSILAKDAPPDAESPGRLRPAAVLDRLSFVLSLQVIRRQVIATRPFPRPDRRHPLHGRGAAHRFAGPTSAAGRHR